MSNTDDIKGRVKEAAGDLTDNERLKREGKADQIEGKVKDLVDDARDKIEDAVDKVRDKLDRKWHSEIVRLGEGTTSPSRSSGRPVGHHATDLGSVEAHPHLPLQGCLVPGVDEVGMHAVRAPGRQGEAIGVARDRVVRLEDELRDRHGMVGGASAVVAAHDMCPVVLTVEALAVPAIGEGDADAEGSGARAGGGLRRKHR